MEAALLPGHVMHRRLHGPDYRFRYRVVSALFDIDRVEDLARNRRWFSLDRFNLFSLHTRDHGRRDGTPWRPWVEARLREGGLEPDGGAILLQATPRVLGHAFNPLSIWYCHHIDGRLQAVLLEVRNTFGQHHHYLLPAGDSAGGMLRGEKDKVFHVSPFIDMDARYAFAVTAPELREGSSMRVAIREYQDDRLLLVATQNGHVRPMTDAALLLQWARMPWMTLQVLFLIHWQALKIWWRGGRYHPRPDPPEKELS